VYDLHLAKKSRLTGGESHREARKWVSGRLAFLFRKSQQQCEEVFKAMTVRGLTTTVKLRRLPPPAVKDGVAGAALLLIGFLLWLL
jgi:cobalt/nickel transport system permease protein